LADDQQDQNYAENPREEDRPPPLTDQDLAFEFVLEAFAMAYRQIHVRSVERREREAELKSTRGQRPLSKAKNSGQKADKF
jgi:hypothetical protein